MGVDADHLWPVPSVFDHHFSVGEFFHVFRRGRVSEAVGVDASLDGVGSDFSDDLVDALVSDGFVSASAEVDPEFCFRIIPSGVEAEVRYEVWSNVEESTHPAAGFPVEVDDGCVLVELDVFHSHVE